MDARKKNETPPPCKVLNFSSLHLYLRKEKTLLLFVIRDHVGSTPLENLSSTLKADLERIWHDLSKV